MPADKSLYAKLNKIYKLDSQPSDAGHLINSKELNDVKQTIGQLIKISQAVLKNMKYLRSSQRRDAIAEVKHVAKHTLVMIKGMAYSVRLVSAVNEAKLKLHQFMILMRFINIMNLVIINISQAALTKEQRSSAVAGIKSTYRIFKKDLIRAHSATSLYEAFTSGINAMNGSLTPYISRSQAYVIGRLDALIHVIKTKISRQTGLSIMVKYLIYRQINDIRDGAQNDVMIATSFIALRQIEQRDMNRLQKISDDHDHVFKDLTKFAKFCNKLSGVVDKRAHVSADARLHLESQIDQYQRRILLRLQRSNGEAQRMLDQKKRHLVQVVVVYIAKDYQHNIARQTLDLNKSQRHSLINHLKVIAKEDTRTFQSDTQKSAIQLLVDSLKRLNEPITSQKADLVYHNQVGQLVSDVKIKIDEVYDLSSSDKAYLKSQVTTFGKQAQEAKHHHQVSLLRNYLHKSLRQQVEYLTRSALSRQLKDLYQQIKLSHLASNQKRYLLQRLNNIKKDTQTNYDDKRLFIKDASSYGLSLDKSENLKRLTRLNRAVYHQAKSLGVSMLEDQDMSQDFMDFSHKIEELKQISAIDHIEQVYENRTYDRLYHSNIQIDPLKVKALQFPINQAREAHREIKLSILQSRFGQYAIDRIDYCLNKHLYIILKSTNPREIKQQLLQFHHGIHVLLSRTLSNVRKEYVERANDLAQDVYHQVMIYQSSHQALDAIESLNSKASSGLNRAGDLLHLERANQQGRSRLNAYADRIVGHIDPAKKSSHHIVNLMKDALLKQLKDNNTGFTSAEVTTASQNIALKITNRAHYRINRSSEDDVLAECHKCHRALNQILRQNCLQEWFRITEQAKLRIQKLFYVPIDPRMKSLRSIQNQERYVANQIRHRDKKELSDILQTNKGQVQQIVRHSVYQDPIKKQVRDRLDSLIQDIRMNIKDHLHAKARSKALNRLNVLDETIDDRLIDGKDKQVTDIYRDGRKQLEQFGLKTIRSAEFKRFDRNTKSIEKQIHQLQLLGDAEFHQIDVKFNVWYHKAIYKIRHASNINTCLNNERHSERVIRGLLIRGRRVNSLKHHRYLNIKGAVKDAKSQVLSLKNLQDKDKKDSYHLLDQINGQVKHDIKESVGTKGADKALKKGRAMVKQVIDKVSSAGVLVSAIKTANNQIRHSTLGSKQKQATLRQINQIVNSGIRQQFVLPHKDSDHVDKHKSHGNDHKLF